MSCRRIRRSLIEYPESDLPEKKREAVLAHLAECADCAALAEKLELSHRALSSLEAASIPEEASGRVLESIRETSRREKTPAVGFFHSPRNLAVAGAVTAVVVAVVLVVGIRLGSNMEKEGGVTTSSLPRAEKSLGYSWPDSLPEAEVAGEQDASKMAVVATPTPVVEVTSNDYNADSLRKAFETLPVNKAFAASFTMTDAINMSGKYIRDAADEFVKLGQDGAVLEAMFSYITAGEPALLPCYVEKARFQGRDVWILGLSAPPRSGKSTNLTRTEVWVMDPVKFQANPDSGVVFFLEQKS